jgi:hypothetical protein
MFRTNFVVRDQNNLRSERQAFVRFRKLSTSDGLRSYGLNVVMFWSNFGAAHRANRGRTEISAAP